MSTTELPKVLDPMHSCQKARQTPYVLSGHMQIGPWLKLGELLEGEGQPNKAAEALATLSFSQDETGVSVIQVVVDVVLNLRCQRCMGELQYAIHTDNRLGIVVSANKLDDLPEQYEPLLLVDPHCLSLPDLLAEEIHLSLPLIPRHEVECKPVFTLESAEIENIQEEAQEKIKPFSVLANIKDKLNKDN